jgi:hypothetical protein
MMTELARQCLIEAVQTNCHIADARHAADMTLCTYLLQMREFFRWESGLPFGASLPRDAVGAWIAERETLWASLEAQPFMPLPLPAVSESAGLDPFDIAGINRCLLPEGLIYGAGMVGANRPVFFLAELHAQQQREGLQLLTAGRELARGLIAPPGTLGRWRDGQDAIVIRRESLARWCWERFEAFTLRRTPGSAFHAVVQAYGLDQDFEAALPRWLEEQAESVLLHELGEHRAGQWLGAHWSALRMSLPTRRGELYARAVRDHLADLEVTLPTLLDRDAQASLHFWFASYDGVRELLFPSLASAYEAWRGGDQGLALRDAILRGKAHFQGLAQRAIDAHLRDAEQSGPVVEALLTGSDAVCPV